MLESINTTIIALVLAAGLITFGDREPSTAQLAENKTEQNESILTPQDKQQIKCLADNVYFEARNQPEKGKLAVLNVVQNRVEDRRFPKTYCGVIKQKTGRTCQFSWVCSGRKSITESVEYRKAYNMSEDFYTEDQKVDVTYGSKFYHAKYVNPGWRYKRTITIGDHIFYRG